MLEIDRIYDYTSIRYLIKDISKNRIEALQLETRLNCIWTIKSFQSEIDKGVIIKTPFKYGDIWTKKKKYSYSNFLDIKLKEVEYHAGLWLWIITYVGPDGIHFNNESGILTYWDPPVNEIVKPALPTNGNCNRCKSPAFIMFTTCECSNLKCRNYKS